MTTFATSCTARHWAYEEPCLRTQPHPGYHVGDQRVWSDEHSGEDLINKIGDLTEALDEAERTIEDMQQAADDLADLTAEQSRKLARLSEMRS